jgi:hypothetical protein
MLVGTLFDLPGLCPPGRNEDTRTFWMGLSVGQNISPLALRREQKQKLKTLNRAGVSYVRPLYHHLRKPEMMDISGIGTTDNRKEQFNDTIATK